MELRIEHTWDGLPVSHDPVAIALQSYDAGLLMQVSAPFFNDPPAPLGAPGKPFRKLWDYEGSLVHPEHSGKGCWQKNLVVTTTTVKKAS